MSLELTPEEQELQDLMDKICNEIYSQLGIPEWKAESAVKATINAYDTYMQKEEYNPKSKWQKFVEGEIALRVERDDYWEFAVNCENCNIMYRGGGVPAPRMNPFHIYPNKKYIIFYCVNPGYTAPWCKLVYTDVAGLKQKHGDIPIKNYFSFKLITNEEEK